ncbi:MAG TPA: low affinity iron permease family protein [Acetobacteraceae bacterium]|nr:low affinity iron permease family protein [Acetobacteraceae bacterium]
MQDNRLSAIFSHVAQWTAQQCGRASTFILACVIILVWAVTGPVFDYSDTWQLIINTGTTIVTFLMVFLMQNTQNRDTVSIQLKLDELIRANENARNAMLSLEDLTEEQLKRIKATFANLAEPPMQAQHKLAAATEDLEAASEKVEQAQEKVMDAAETAKVSSRAHDNAKAP